MAYQGRAVLSVQMDCLAPSASESNRHDSFSEWGMDACSLSRSPRQILFDQVSSWIGREAIATEGMSPPSEVIESFLPNRLRVGKGGSEHMRARTHRTSQTERPTQHMVDLGDRRLSADACDCNAFAIHGNLHLGNMPEISQGRAKAAGLQPSCDPGLSRFSMERRAGEGNRAALPCGRSMQPFSPPMRAEQQNRSFKGMTRLRRMAEEERSQQERGVEASILMLDVSGFSKLCAKYTSEGTAGCEGFSLIISDYMSRLVDIVESFGGDVEAFAGDALIVMFYAKANNCSGCCALEMAVLKAIACAKTALEEHGAFALSQDVPVKLSLHAAVAAGELWSLEAVGRLSERVEAFLVGSPLSELSDALQQAGSLDLVASASAWSIVKDKCTGQALGQGCVLVHEYQKPWLSRSGSNSSSSSSVVQNYDIEDLRISSCRTLQDMLRATPSSTQSRFREGGSMKGDDRNVRCYIPSFVVQKVEAGMAAGRLAEHRFVSILFLVHQDACELVPPFGRQACHRRLQNHLGAVIDVVETKWGGSTRQITCDDKGLTAIFVFGLTGADTADPPCVSVMAALDSLKIVQKMEMGTWTAGVSAGFCFCGPVGNIKTRCEYVIMGDAVVTAARMAAQAAKHHRQILCSEAVYAAFQEQQFSYSKSRLKMTHAGEAMLKGGTSPAQLYYPEIYDSEMSLRPRRSRSSSAFQPAEDDTCPLKEPEKGMQQHILTNSSMIFDVLRKMLQPGCPQHLFLLDGTSGMGKEGMIDQVHSWIETSHVHQQAPKALTIRVSCDSGNHLIPFYTCDQILVKLSHLLGADSEPVLNVLVQDVDAEPHLPGFLERFASEVDYAAAIQCLEMRRRALRRLYTRMIAYSFAQLPASSVLFIDDIHWLDAESWKVMTCPDILCSSSYPSEETLRADDADNHSCVHGSFELSDENGEEDCKHRSAASAGRFCTVFVYSSHPYMEYPQADEQANFENLCSLGTTVHLELHRLDDQGIEAVALEFLQASEMSKHLLELLAGYSQGVPSFALEFVKWLKDQRLVALNSNGVYQLQVNDVEALELPPLLHSLILATLDHLPLSLSLVLKCSSVMGLRFATSDILKLVPTMAPYATVTHASIESDLYALANLKVIRNVPDSTVSKHGTPQEWEFCSTLHKEVAHETLLHKDRKQLHRVAALICDQEAEMWPMEERLSEEFFKIQKELARQWLCAVHDTVLARQSLAQFSDDTWQADLKLAAFAIEELLDLSCKRGIGKLSSPETYMDALLDIAQRIAGPDGGWMLESRTLRRLASHMLCESFRPSVSQAEALKRQKTCLELHLRADCMAKRHRLDHGTANPQSQENEQFILKSISGHSQMSLLVSMDAVAEGTRPLDMLMSEILVGSLTGGAQTGIPTYQQAEHLEFKVKEQVRRLTEDSDSDNPYSFDVIKQTECYGQHCCSLLYFLRGDFEKCSLLSKDSYRKWMLCGCPELRNVFGASFGPMAQSLSQVSDMIRGGLPQAWLEPEAADTAGMEGISYAYSAFGEALWDSPCSDRDTALLQKARTFQMCLPDSNVFHECLVEGLTTLSSASKASEAVSGKEEWVAPVLALVNNAALRKGPLLFLVPVAAKMIARKIWEDMDKLMLTSGRSSAAGAYKPARAALRRCTEVWERLLLDKEDISSGTGPRQGFLSASLAYCKAAQSWLDVMASNSATPNDLQEAFASFKNVYELASTNPKDAGLCEPLSAGVPAVLAMCRLVTYDCKKSRSLRLPRALKLSMRLTRSKRGVHVKAPSKLRIHRGNADCNEECLLHIGSDEAKRWAATTLAGILDDAVQHSLTASSNCADWRQAQNQSQLQGSQTLWDTLCLFRSNENETPETPEQHQRSWNKRIFVSCSTALL